MVPLCRVWPQAAWAWLGLALDLAGPGWACLGLPGPAWARLGLAGPGWACLGLAKA